MKFTYRRQKKQYFFAIVLGAIAAINALFFLTMYRPARNEYYGLQQSIERLHREIRTRRDAVGRLESLRAQLETSEQDRHTMYTSHFLKRDTGFGEILPELEAIAERVGVSKTRVDYSIAPDLEFGLYSVKINIPVTGTYSSIVKFIQELEKSETFFIIGGISLGSAGDAASEADAAGDGGAVALSMAMETFFYQ